MCACVHERGEGEREREGGGRRERFGIKVFMCTFVIVSL